MKNAEQKERPKYSHIEHQIREKFGLSLNEYGIADSIDKLCTQYSKYPGWCYASKETLGEFIGLSRHGAHNIIVRLINKKLVERNPNQFGQVKTTKLWHDNMVVYIPKQKK